MALDSGTGEPLARFITQRSHFRSSDNTVKPNAFMPPAHGRLSVYMVEGLTEMEIWNIGDTVVAPALRSDVLGRAHLNSLKVYENGLSVNAAPAPHPLHADIVGWDLESTATRLIAIKLAAAAEFKKKSPPAA